MFQVTLTLFTGLDLFFLDTTSLYFEGEGGQTLGEKGHSKDHRPDLNQIMVGTLIDDTGRPVCCEIWPGNKADVKTLVPVADRTAFHQAWMGVASGFYDCTLAIGAEKLYDEDKAKMFGAFWTEIDVDNIPRFMDVWMKALADIELDIPNSENSRGAGRNRNAFMDIDAGMCRWHMATYGMTQRQLAVIASKNHFHSSLNPYAQFQNEMNIEEILSALDRTDVRAHRGWCRSGYSLFQEISQEVKKQSTGESIGFCSGIWHRPGYCRRG